jgi:hypothetical protein
LEGGFSGGQSAERFDPDGTKFPKGERKPRKRRKRWTDTKQRVGSDEPDLTGDGREGEQSTERASKKFSVVPMWQVGSFDPAMVASREAVVAGERKVAIRYRS